MEQFDEITFEITNKCLNNCKYCSSNSVPDGNEYISYVDIKNALLDKKYHRIIISGGEPLFHPVIGYIIELCKNHADDVVVYSNLITHIAYNAHVIDGIKVDCMLNVPDDVSSIKILKRVKQGREKTRPELTFSCNFEQDCNCNKTVMLSSGILKQSACRKE